MSGSASASPSPMVSPEMAWSRIADQLAILPAETVSRRDGLGRVLAENLSARVDVPATDVSAMDGYAVALGAANDPGAGISLPVSGTLAAGAAPGAELAAGTAVRIMTGAPVPHGADRVIPVELTSGGGPQGDAVAFTGALSPGANIRRQGEVERRGELLLRSGGVLGPGALGLLASHGYDRIRVHGAPTVAVLTTGDEVVAPEREPLPGQLRDSHTDFLLGSGREIGLEFDVLGIAPDRADALEDLLRAGMERDVLLVGGGVSMGAFDLVEGVLAKLGCTILFDAVAMQPGKPMVAARHPRGWVFGLPGNPASVMVTYRLLVRPALRRMMGHEDGFWHGAETATLTAAIPSGGPRERFLPATLRREAGRLSAAPHLPRGSHDLTAYAKATGLLRAGPGSLAAGSACEVLAL